VVLAVAAMATVAPAASSAPADELTLQVDRYFDPSFGRFRIHFSGTIPSRVANEYVTVMAEKCGQPFATAVAGGTTRPDGSWEDTFRAFSFGGTAVYRARWNGQLSPPVRVRGELQVSVNRRSRGRYVVAIPADANLSRRPVRVQRLSSGRWMLFRRVLLQPGGGSGTAFIAEFTVRQRGLRLRVVVPATTARPCYGPAVTQPFVS
jgi:hypothetical protein